MLCNEKEESQEQVLSQDQSIRKSWGHGKVKDYFFFLERYLVGRAHVVRWMKEKLYVKQSD